MEDLSLSQAGDDRIAIAIPDTGSGQALLPFLLDLPHVIDAVGGIASVEVRFDLAAVNADEFAAALEACLAAFDAPVLAAGRLHTIPVEYGGRSGTDFDDVCRHLELSAAQFAERHAASRYTVAMLGFTPGFAYLDGMDPALSLPRRSVPRVRVPAGSVGIAGGRSGVYALPGPGGWQLIGRVTGQASGELFSTGREDPFLLKPGDTVRFVPAPT